jgi:nitroreductase
MDLIEGILSRQSIGRVVEPGPGPDSVQRALKCAMAAPDHGRLRPWRFILCAGDDRHRLGRIFGRMTVRQQPAASPALIAQEEARAMRAPLVIIAALIPVANTKIPEIERILAVGSAVQNLCLSLHADGFGTIWRTGPAAYDPEVTAALGLPAGSRIIGFVYVGTPDQSVKDPVRPDPRSYLLDFKDAAGS